MSRPSANGETLPPLAESEIHNKLAVDHQSSHRICGLARHGPLPCSGPSTWQVPRFSFAAPSPSRRASEELCVFEEQASA